MPPDAVISSTTALRRVGVEVVHDDAGALGREQAGVTGADAAARAGDDRGLAVEDAHDG